MRRLFLVPALLIALIPAASAQTIVIKQNERTQPPAHGPAVEEIRISIGINTFVPTPSADSADALKAQEAAYRIVYDLAGRQCAILRETLASDCRLESVNITTQRIAANQSPGRVEGFNINGNIGYRIVAK